MGPRAGKPAKITCGFVTRSRGRTIAIGSSRWRKEFAGLAGSKRFPNATRRRLPVGSLKRMADQITGKQFDESPGVGDWRALWGGGIACAYFRTGTFAAGAALVKAISDISAAANHHVDVDLRPEGVTVRLFTHEPGGLSDDDVGLAREISAAASKLGLPAEPSAVQHVQVAIDSLVTADVLPFCRA